MVRKVGVDLTVFSISGGDILGVVTDATVSVEIKTEDASAIRDGWEYAIPVGAKWSVDSDCYIETLPALMAEAISGDRMFTVVMNTGAGVYSGTLALTSANHSLSRQSLQKHKFAGAGHGPLTVA